MTLACIGDPKPELLPGLALTRMQKPVAARVAMRRERDGNFKNRSYTKDELKEPHFQTPEFVETILPLITNGCEFKLREKIMFRNPRKDGGSVRAKPEETTQSDMVTFVGDLLDGRFSLVSPGTKDHKPFNPAAHVHYPFNQAIVLEV